MPRLYGKIIYPTTKVAGNALPTFLLLPSHAQWKPVRGQKEILPRLQPLEEHFHNENKETTEALNQDLVLNAVFNQNVVSISWDRKGGAPLPSGWIYVKVIKRTQSPVWRTISRTHLLVIIGDNCMPQKIIFQLQHTPNHQYVVFERNNFTWEIWINLKGTNAFVPLHLHLTVHAMITHPETKPQNWLITHRIVS